MGLYTAGQEGASPPAHEGKAAFVDSVGMLLAEPLPQRTLKRLRRASRYGRVTHKAMQSKSSSGRWLPQIMWKLRVHQPLPRAFVLLAEIAAERDVRLALAEADHDLYSQSGALDLAKLAALKQQYIAAQHHGKLSEIHVALDLLSSTTDLAQQMKRWVWQHLAVPYHRGKVKHFENCSYTDRRRWRKSGFCLYADKPSKVEPARPCCHIEYRAMGCHRVRMLGVHSVTDLAALNNDLAGFWSKRLLLDGFTLDRELCVVARYGELAIEDEDMTALGIRRACRTLGIHPEKYLKRIDNSCVLGPPNGSMTEVSDPSYIPQFQPQPQGSHPATAVQPLVPIYEIPALSRVSSRPAPQDHAPATETAVTAAARPRIRLEDRRCGGLRLVSRVRLNPITFQETVCP